MTGSAKWKALLLLPLLACSVLTHAEPRQPDAGPQLSAQLAAMRETWLHGDETAAAARLDALLQDNRLDGELPRWYAGLRATLALRDGKLDDAAATLKPVLDSSQDARNYVRAARLLLAYGDIEGARSIIAQGLVRKPDSLALQRVEAGLLWLSGSHDAALARYTEMIVKDGRAMYPHVAPATGRWSATRPWDAETDKPQGRSRLDEWGDSVALEDWQPEPFADIFTPVHWFPSDLPGMDRCIMELANDAERVGVEAARLEALRKDARTRQEDFEALRTGTDEQRTELLHRATRARVNLSVATRIAALGHMRAGEWVKAEEALKDSLLALPEDIALTDILAEALGKLGKAEEARTGPLTRLRNLAGLNVSVTALAAGQPAAQMIDRVLEPSLNLYRANPEAALVQIEAASAAFGETGRVAGIPPSSIGFWFAMRGEPTLARRFLMEASRLDGHESGRAIEYYSMMGELALIMVGEGGEQAEGDPVQPPPGQDDEIDPVDVARLSADSNPLLRQALRVGSILSAAMDVRERVQAFGDIQLWSNSAGMYPLVGASELLPEGEAVLRFVMYEIAARIAAEVPDAELAAVLAPDHATAKTLGQALDGMADQMDQLRGSDNWRTRQSLSQRSGPVLGMVEARAILLRAQLIKDAPADLEAVRVWLEKYQPQIDARARLRARSNDLRLRFQEQRAEAQVPEVVHTGLLLEAARSLARSGARLDAARLLWFNRDATLGVETQVRLLSLAAVLADGADAVLAARCRVAAGSGTPNPQVRAANPLLLLVELPTARMDLLEFGGVAAVCEYIETQMLKDSDSEMLMRIARIAPEFKDLHPDALLRASSRTLVDSLFQRSVTSANVQGIHSYWARLLHAPDMLQTCHRLAAWVLVSDFTQSSGRSGYNGLSNAREFASAVSILRELYRAQGADSAEAVAGLSRLTRLLNRLAGDPAKPIASHQPWWG
jgi:tetratricopeptide (TPR) repeat protein